MDAAKTKLTSRQSGTRKTEESDSSHSFSGTLVSSLNHSINNDVINIYFYFIILYPLLCYEHKLQLWQLRCYLHYLWARTRPHYKKNHKKKKISWCWLLLPLLHLPYPLLEQLDNENYRNYFFPHVGEAQLRVLHLANHLFWSDSLPACLKLLCMGRRAGAGLARQVVLL